jgi:hypothetical protein
MAEKTLLSQAQKSTLSFTLKDLNISENSNYDIPNQQNITKLFEQFVVFTPTNQSHLGDKFDAYKKLNNSTTDNFVRKLLRALDIKLENTFFFTAFNKNNGCNVLNPIPLITQFNYPTLCLNCTNGIKNALYSNLRNAIAHGNIVCFDNSYILYSLTSTNKEQKNEYSTHISFLLRVHSLKKLEAFITVLEEYR